MFSCSLYAELTTPGVSEKTTWCSASFTIPRIRCRVVCAFEVTIESFSPTSLFISVDFPTFGLPTIFTNPDLCAICSINCRINSGLQRNVFFDGLPNKVTMILWCLAILRGAKWVSISHENKFLSKKIRTKPQQNSRITGVGN